MNQGNIGICTVITEEELSGLLNNISVNFQTGKNLTFHPQKDITLEIKHNMAGYDIDGKMYYIEDTGDVIIKVSHEPIVKDFTLSKKYRKQVDKEAKTFKLKEILDESKENRLYAFICAISVQNNFRDVIFRILFALFFSKSKRLPYNYVVLYDP